MKAMMKLTLALALFGAQPARPDTPAVHGMLLFGDQVTYVSHLPMFQAPHDYQLLMKVSFDADSSTTALSAYEHLKARGWSFFTLAPEVVDLSQVISGEKTHLEASLFQGDFENGGRNLGTIRIHVDRILHASKLDGSQAPTDHEDYFVFGESGEYFSAHLIGSRPSFDEILKVSQPYVLDTGLCRTRTCSEPVRRLIEDGKLPLVISMMNGGNAPGPSKAGDQLGDPGGPLVDVIQNLHFNRSDLSQ